MRYLVIGGGGSNLRSVGSTPGVTVHSESVYHYVVTEVDAQQFSVTPYRADGSLIDDAFALTSPAP